MVVIRWGAWCFFTVFFIVVRVGVSASSRSVGRSVGRSINRPWGRNALCFALGNGTVEGVAVVHWRSFTVVGGEVHCGVHSGASGDASGGSKSMMTSQIWRLAAVASGRWLARHINVWLCLNIIGNVMSFANRCVFFHPDQCHEYTIVPYLDYAMRVIFVGICLILWKLLG